MGRRTYYVYITSNPRRTVLYIGVTNDLSRRIYEHKNGSGSGFSKRYNVSDLLYYEAYGEVTQAIQREKQLKAWGRGKKLDLIRGMNVDLVDLAGEIRPLGTATES